MKKTIVRITCIITVMIIITLSIQGYRLNQLIKRVENQIVVDEDELTSGKKELKKLQKEITQMNTPEYIERVAREELSMVKEDDIVFREKK